MGLRMRTIVCIASALIGLLILFNMIRSNRAASDHSSVSESECSEIESELDVSQEYSIRNEILAFIEKQDDYIQNCQ
jgi:hypothetical protein